MTFGECPVTVLEAAIVTLNELRSQAAKMHAKLLAHASMVQFFRIVIVSTSNGSKCALPGPHQASGNVSLTDSNPKLHNKTSPCVRPKLRTLKAWLT